MELQNQEYPAAVLVPSDNRQPLITVSLRRAHQNPQIHGKPRTRDWPFAPLTVAGVWGRSKIGMGCGATKMYLFGFFAKKPMKASHGRSKTTVNKRAFLHAVDLCSTVSRKTESKPVWFPDMSKTRQPAYPRNIIFKKTKCAYAMQEIETSNGKHSIRQ